MLKKKYRFRQRYPLQKPSVIHTPFFTMRYALNNLPYSRFGFVVSKKVDKRAVVRNKVKRKIRIFIENIQERIRGGYDILFFLRRRIVMEDTFSLHQQLEKVFKKVNLLT